VTGADESDNAYKPKRGKQLEAGLKWAPKDGRIAASAAVYRLKEKNRLTTDPFNPLNSIQGGEVTVNGIELESTATFGAWSFVGNYTFTDATTSASSDPADPSLDKQLASIPEHSAALWTTHAFTARPLRGLRAGLGIRYVGETWDGTDTIRTPSNTLFDALISYDRGRWHYALNASNLFDKTYIATALTRGDSWFGPRRKVIATVSYRW
jgi:iron complex outermembrane receptor protein